MRRALPPLRALLRAGAAGRPPRLPALGGLCGGPAAEGTGGGKVGGRGEQPAVVPRERNRNGGGRSRTRRGAASRGAAGPGAGGSCLSRPAPQLRGPLPGVSPAVPGMGVGGRRDGEGGLWLRVVAKGEAGKVVTIAPRAQGFVPFVVAALQVSCREGSVPLWAKGKK